MTVVDPLQSALAGPASMFAATVRAIVAGRRVIAYARISDDSRGRRYGVTRQHDSNRAVAADFALVISMEYEDNDRSAYRGLHRRHDYELMCADLETGEVGGLLCLRPDRLSRDGPQGERLLATLIRHRVLLIFNNRMPVDVTTPEGEKWFRTQVAEARYESQVLSIRARWAAAAFAAKGRMSNGGMRPFGYDDDRITIRKAEAARIREAVRRIEVGESIRGICGDFNLRGIATVTGTPWRSSVMRRMLSSARICGLRSHKGVIVATAEWPEIISPKRGARVRAILAERARRCQQPARRYLLSGGKLRCGACGAALVARPKQDGRRQYVCALPPNFSGCGKRASLAEPLENHVVGALLQRLDSPAVWKALRQPSKDDEHPAIVGALEERRLKLAENSELWRNGTLATAEYVDNIRELHADIDQLSRRLARTHRVVLLRDLDGPGMLRDRWATLHIDRQRAVLDVLIASIELGSVSKGRTTFDPRRVHITWRV